MQSPIHVTAFDSKNDFREVLRHAIGFKARISVPLSEDEHFRDIL